MSKTMKRTLVLIILLFSLISGLYAQQEWMNDAVRADKYYNSGDFDAAWLFYRRALAAGCDDGLFLYRAADSFRRQEIEENAEFGEALYAVAHHFLLEQYPDNPARTESEKYFSDGTVVNRRFMKNTYSFIGGDAPRIRNPVDDGFGAVSGFFNAQLEKLGDFVLILKTQGLRDALTWIRGRFFQLLFAWIVVSSLTGIILPVVMALTVAREGRKSYVTAYAFLAHWGIFGIHRFYLGRYLSGIIWLLTAGLFGIGVFFDLFLTGAYVRFWNEDNKDNRPTARAAGVRHGSVSTSRPVRPAKPPKAKAAKPVKAKKAKSVKKVKAGKPVSTAGASRSNDRISAVAPDTGAASAGGSASKPIPPDLSAEEFSIDDEFDSFPDSSSFNDEDFGIGDASGSAPESGPVDDDEFDLKAFE